MTDTRAPLVAYFSRPFPKAIGFSAYRMPGPAVHVPVIMLSITAGGWLCGESALWPALLAVYLVVGVYAGRDLAILAHYNVLISLGVWLCFLVVLVSPARVRNWAHALASVSPVLPWMVTTAILAAFVTHVASSCRRG